MLSAESIVSAVKNGHTKAEVEPLPLSWYDYEMITLTIPQSINYTLGCLGDQPTPFAGAQLVERSITTKKEDGLARIKTVETAIWPILTYNPVYGLNAKIEYRELVIDAYGDLMGRRITRTPGQLDTPSELLVFSPEKLRDGQVNRVLYELKHLREQLDEQVLLPSFV